MPLLLYYIILHNLICYPFSFRRSEVMLIRQDTNFGLELNLNESL